MKSLTHIDGRGLPKLLDDNAVASRSRSTAYVSFLQTLRVELAESLRGRKRMRSHGSSLQKTADRLIGMWMLFDFVCQRDRSALPPLGAILSSLRQPTLRRLSERACSATDNAILSHMFACYPFRDDRQIPKSVANGSWLSKLSKISRGIFGCGARLRRKQRRGR